MFPMKHLHQMVVRTNTVLHQRKKALTTDREVLKFFGVIILATKYEFESRASLWSETSPLKMVPAPRFGTITGMSCRRFDTLWQYLQWSFCPAERPVNMSSETYRWKLVDDFVAACNKHRAATFIPSERICVDESISQWYGHGGQWINMGLPMYIAIDQ